jgi:glycosyltransferase 2 family protein
VIKRTIWLRLLGLALLVVLLWWLDLEKIGHVLSVAHGLLIGVAVATNVPMVFLKTVRWQVIMRSQGIHYDTRRAYLAYWSSIFVGFFTPGRVGEFIKAAHVSQDRGVSMGRAFSSVLADRLFDLYALLLAGSTALLALSGNEGSVLALVGAVVLLMAPLGLFLDDRFFSWVKRQVHQLEIRFLTKNGFLSRIFAEGSWLIELRRGFRQMTWPWLLVATVLTIGAYLVFFAQCYLLALALQLPVGFVPVLYSVALGSLVTLLPISISGLGTREAAIIAYLGTVGISAEAALSFSLLVFITFYVAGGLMGAVAWWLKPVAVAKIQPVSLITFDD